MKKIGLILLISCATAVASGSLLEIVFTNIKLHQIESRIDVLRIQCAEYQQIKSDNALLKKQRISDERLIELRSDHLALARLESETNKLEASILKLQGN